MVSGSDEFLMLRLIYNLEHGATKDSNTQNAHTSSQSVIISLRRRAKHLCPRLYRRSTNILPANYWLLLLAGDVEINPGPVRFLCTVCQKPVKRNQRGTECSNCTHWTHAKCGGISPEDCGKHTYVDSCFKDKESHYRCRKWCPGKVCHTEHHPQQQSQTNQKSSL